MNIMKKESSTVPAKISFRCFSQKEVIVFSSAIYQSILARLTPLLQRY